MPLKKSIEKSGSGVETDTCNSKLLKTTAYLIILVGILFSLLLSEFYNVAIGGQSGAYPWGPVNENPWYYRTAYIYSVYNLASGILFLAASILTLWATVKKNRRLVVLGVSITLLFLLAALVSTNAQ